MATHTAVQNTILSASYLAATLTNKNLQQLNVGNAEVDWTLIRKLVRNTEALTIQYNWGVYSSLTLYDCLNDLIGFDTTVNSIDPNYQPPSGSIIITTPTQPPIDISWSDFDAATQNADGNRYIYYNANWKGLNPMLWLISPAGTALFLGVDYTLIVDGGIQLLTDLSAAGSPGIAYGQELRATGYNTA